VAHLSETNLKRVAKGCWGGGVGGGEEWVGGVGGGVGGGGGFEGWGSGGATRWRIGLDVQACWELHCQRDTT